MDMDLVVIFGCLFIGLPWIVFHYITKWRSMGSLTQQDEHLLEDLHAMARRLDERMQTVERLVASEDPDWKQVAAPRTTTEIGSVSSIDRYQKERNGQ